MTTENPNNENNLKNDDDLVDSTTSQVVTLSTEQYAALLDRLNELESSGSKSKIYTLDELAEAGTEKKEYKEKPPVTPDKDINEMSPRELAQYVINVLDGHFTPIANNLQTEIETLKVLNEINKCESKYNDFYDYQNDIMRIAKENPSLSVEKAYKLAKAERGDTTDKQTTKPKNVLLTLPPKPIPGEKPGVSRSVTDSKSVTSIRDAAMKAWDGLGEKEE